MTHDDIIKMATRVGLKDCLDLQGDSVAILILEAFANLVADREREECARVCETLWDTPWNGMATEEKAHGAECANEIRARGKR